MAINKHGLVMRGLKRTSGMTKDYGDYDGRYIELFYDRKSGEMFIIRTDGEMMWFISTQVRHESFKFIQI